MLNNLFEQRKVSFQTIWGSGESLGLDSNSGQNVTADKSFQIVAFFSAVSLISDTISTLPVDSFVRRDGERIPYRPRPQWIDQPDIDTTKQAHYQQLLVSLLVHGNSYTRVFRDSRGEVVNLMVLDPDTVDVKRNAVGRKMFIIEGENKTLTSEDVIHIPDLLLPGHIKGISRVEKLKEALGLNLAIQEYAAKFYGTGANPSGVIEFPGNLTGEQASQLADGFDSRHRNSSRRAHRTGVLSGGAKFVDTQVDPERAQALESRRFAVEEIARAFNIPPHLLGVPGSMSYASVEQNAIQWVTHGLRPLAEKVEWAYSRLLPNEAFIKFNFSALLRGDYQTRIQSYSVAAQAGFMSINDIRRLEDLSPTEGGDVYRVPLANINLLQADVVADDRKVLMANRLVTTGFDPEQVLAALGLPAIPHTGVPSVMLQGVAQIDPESPESVYGA
jgi:HK97 family phage portal protein